MARNMVCSGGKAYFTSVGGLQILDISSPANPKRVGGTSTDTDGLAVSGDYAYVTGYNGFEVIDIRNASNPVHIGGITNIGTSGKIATSGSRAYVTVRDYQATLYILDISNPATPFLLGKTNIPDNALSVAVSDNRVFMGVGSYLRIMDVSNPANPVPMGSLFLTNNPVSIAAFGSLVYVAVDWSGLQIVDVSDPTNPIRLGGTQITNAFATQLVRASNYVFMADSSGLEVIDISSTAAPAIVAKYSATFQPSYMGSVGISGSYLFLGGYAGVHVLDISNPVTPTRVGGLITSGSVTRGVAVSDNHAYLIDQYAGLQVIDTSNAWNPVLVGDYFTGGDPVDIAISGRYAYLLDTSNGLQVFNISNPAAPLVVGGCSITNTPRSVTISGNFAYVTHDKYPYLVGMSIIDLTNPSSPTNVATYFVNFQDISWRISTAQAKSVTVSGTVAYLTFGGEGYQREFENPPFGGLDVVNVSNPASPARVGTYPASYPYAIPGIALSGSYAYGIYFKKQWGIWYLCGGTNVCHQIIPQAGGLEVMDLSNPTNPVSKAQFETGQQHSQIVLTGNFAFLLGGSPDLRVFDISNPTNLLLVASNNIGVQRMVISGHYAYGASGYPGLQIFCLECPRLSAEPAGGQILIKWSPGSINHVLESADSIVSPQWQPVPGTPQISNGFYQILIPTKSGGIFRLRGQ